MIETMKESFPTQRSPSHEKFKQRQFKRYKISDERKEINQLNDWISAIMVNEKSEGKKQADLMVEKVHSLHLAFSELCRNAGKYSQPLA